MPTTEKSQPGFGSETSRSPKSSSAKRKNVGAAVDTSKKGRLRKDLELLHKEMEVADYPRRPGTNQRCRRVPRSQLKVRKEKRRHLEKLDQHEMDGSGSDDNTERLRWRGPQAAHEKDILEGSFVFGNLRKGAAAANEQSESDHEHGQESDAASSEQATSDDELDEAEDGNEDEAGNVEGEGEGDDDDDEDGDDDVDGVDDDDDDNDIIEVWQLPPEESYLPDGRNKKLPKRNSKGQYNHLKSKKRRYRMKSFKSEKMSKRHGEAIKAHARGQPALAIQKLQAIAKDNPLAPQIYASLGSVYGDLVQKLKNDTGNQTDTGQSTKNYANIPDDRLAKLISLATKMYGAYHVAACLCTKDYALWCRAADAATEISGFYRDVLLLPNVELSSIPRHRSGVQRWLSEAKCDYQRATKLHPPGIDTACTYAVTLVELGDLATALTILTDLKNNPSKGPEFNASYSAWLLYADVMLRIGYECSKWTSGDKSVENSSFRRWLRKMASSFNWKERRLQALVKALEAAAGTKSCARLLFFMHQRAAEQQLSQQGADVQGPDRVSEAERDEEVERIQKENQRELQQFDQATEEMADTGGSSETARKIEREFLVASQNAVLEEVLNANDSQLVDDEAAKEFHEMSSALEDLPQLPISASGRVVWEISTSLVRLALDMRLFETGKLACESTVQYFRERSEKLASKLEKRRRVAAMDNLGSSLYQEVSYDAIGSDSDSNASDMAFSDDEQSFADESELLSSLRLGALPPDLKFLHGVCLACLGNSQYVAKKFIQSVKFMPDETRGWLNAEIVDTGPTPDYAWQIYHRNTIAPLTRTSALALLTEILRDNQEAISDQPDFSELFFAQVVFLNKSGIMTEALANGFENRLDQYRRKAVFSVVEGAVLCHLKQIEVGASPISRERAAEVTKLFSVLVDSLAAIFHVDNLGAVPRSCIDLLSILSRCVRVLGPFFVSQPDNLFSVKLEYLIKILCKIPDKSLDIGDQRSLNTMRSLPFSQSFQSEGLRKLSLWAHNCAVATNCTHFSGWEDAQFSTGLLKNVDAPYFSAVTFEDGHVFGVLEDQYVSRLSKQWEGITKLFPESKTLVFDTQMAIASGTEKFSSLKTSLLNTREKGKICMYGEEFCLDLLLAFSSHSLQRARTSADLTIQRKSKGVALSILLPLCQYALHHELWTSKLGVLDKGQSGLIEWRSLQDNQWMELQKRQLRAEQPGKPRPVVQEGWYEFERADRPLLNLVYISPSQMESLWQASCIPTNHVSEHELAMRSLDTELKNLRLCFSEQAVEVQAPRVASKLVALATLPACKNPFLCISQAAMFAKTCRRTGLSSDLFKLPLPKVVDCSIGEALHALGNAACLQSQCCFPEAAFLCRYVASVCSAHRQENNHGLQWDSRWKLVSIANYNQTVLLRTMFYSDVRENGQKEDCMKSWGAMIVDELKQAMTDGTKMESADDRNAHEDSRLLTEITKLGLSTAGVRSVSANHEGEHQLRAVKKEDDTYDTPSTVPDAGIVDVVTSLGLPQVEPSNESLAIAIDSTQESAEPPSLIGKGALEDILNLDFSDKDPDTTTDILATATAAV